MDNKQKQSLLSQLAQTQGEVPQKALEKEAEKIAAKLQCETNYNVIESQIEFLDAFAYRVSKKAFEIAQALLKRMPQMDVTYDKIDGFPEERLKAIYKPHSLIVRLLALLKNIRYHMPDEILRTFLEYSLNDNEIVSKEASDDLKVFADFNLDIFYGDGKAWGGLGSMPQQRVVALFDALTSEERKKYFNGLIVLCDCLLEPSITGTTSTYDKMTFRTGALPASAGVPEIRQKTIAFLDELYALSVSPKQKKKIVSTLNAATRPSHSGQYGDDVKQMLQSNTVDVLKIYQRIVASESDMETIQHIEHQAYWLHHNRGDDAVSKEALIVKSIIDEKPEYQIFKALIGFEGIFKPWRTRGTDNENEDKEWENEFRHTEEVRNQRVEEYSSAITNSNFAEWRERILNYAKIESNDMATFPFFARFLEKFSQKSPDIAIQLIEEHPTALDRFLPCFFYGLLETSAAVRLRELMLRWIRAGQYLNSIARVYEYKNDLDVELLDLVLQKALESTHDRDIAVPALRQLIAAVTANYNENRKPLINTIFLESVRALTSLGDAVGLLNIWFRKEAAALVEDMGAPVLDAVLDNLLLAKSIDYHAEQILTFIAHREPSKVIDFFGKRLASKAERELINGYDAVPYEFHILQKSLSLIPEQAVDIVSSWYDGNYGLFIYRGAKLLNNIFPDFPEPFQNKLIQLVQSGNKDKQMVVMAVLRNYDGKPIIHVVCKELIKTLDEDSEELKEIGMILDSTGVVEGEYGFANAYQVKKEEIAPWLDDKNDRVRLFAKKHIEQLDAQIDWAKKRADEDIELRKFKYD